MLFSLLFPRSSPSGAGCIISFAEGSGHIQYVDFQASEGVHVVAVRSSGRSKLSTLSVVAVGTNDICWDVAI